MTIRFFLLLDYEQAPFLVHQVEAVEDAVDIQAAAPPPALPFAETLDVTASPATLQAYRFWTEPLGPGSHALAFVVVFDPERLQAELPYDTAFRPTLDASVEVPPATMPTPRFPPLDPSPVEAPQFTNLLLLSNEPGGTKRSSGQRARPGEEVRFFLRYQPHAAVLNDGVTGDGTVPVALVAFIDDRVVPMNGHPVVYASARVGSLSTLPITVRAPDEPGVHQLFLLAFPQPYRDRHPFFGATHRATIEVTP